MPGRSGERQPGSGPKRCDAHKELPQVPEKPDANIKRVPFTCTMDCGSRCELVAIMSGERLLRIDTSGVAEDTDDCPRLIPCARGRAHRRLIDVRERLLYPLRRTGKRGSGEFERISWDEAAESIADKLETIREEYSTESILCATGAGSIFGRGISGGRTARRFFSYWGDVSTTAGNMSTHCVSLASTWIYGNRIGSADRSDLCNSKLIILWGMNPAETRIGPNTNYYIAKARDCGAKVILIDARYSDSGVLCDQWIPIRPGTDAALAAALAYLLEKNGCVDRVFLKRCTLGYEAYLDYVMGRSDGTPKTPEWAASITGVPVNVIVELGEELGTRKPTAILPGFGPQRARYGEQFARAMMSLACLAGNVGIPGGDAASLAAQFGGSFGFKSMPRGRFGSARKFSNITWAKEIKNASPPVKMLYIVAANLINRSPDSNANLKAFEAMDLVVVHDQFMTPTAKWADIVLPICLSFEEWALGPSWCQSHDAFLSQPISSPPGESRTDYAAFAEIAARLGFEQEYTHGRTEKEWIDFLAERSNLPVDALRKNGVVRSGKSGHIPLADFRKNPAEHPLATKSGMIELCNPKAAEFDLPEVGAYVESDHIPDENYPLQVLTPHSRLRANSCLAANPWLQRLEPHAAWISSHDAEARSIKDGDTVEVVSPFGSILIPAKVTERIMPGVVCVYYGTWHNGDSVGPDRGGCANTLTEQRVSPTGGMATHSNWVNVIAHPPETPPEPT